MADEAKPSGQGTPNPPADAPTSLAGGTPEVKPGETKPAEVKPAEVKPGDKEAPKPDAKKAPDKYALQVPEGGRVDNSDLAAVEKIARENNWTNEEAQEQLDAIAERVGEQAERWRVETTADKTYGGDNLPATQKLATQAISRIRPEGHPRRESFLAFMNRGGAGNHLEVVSFLADLGKLIAEDSPQLGTGGGGEGAKDAATVLYGAEKK